MPSRADAGLATVSQAVPERVTDVPWHRARWRVYDRRWLDLLLNVTGPCALRGRSEGSFLDERLRAVGALVDNGVLRLARCQPEQAEVTTKLPACQPQAQQRCVIAAGGGGHSTVGPGGGPRRRLGCATRSTGCPHHARHSSERKATQRQMEHARGRRQGGSTWPKKGWAARSGSSCAAWSSSPGRDALHGGLRAHLRDRPVHARHGRAPRSPPYRKRYAKSPRSGFVWSRTWLLTRTGPTSRRT